VYITVDRRDEPYKTVFAGVSSINYNMYIIILMYIFLMNTVEANLTGNKSEKKPEDRENNTTIEVDLNYAPAVGLMR